MGVIDGSRIIQLWPAGEMVRRLAKTAKLDAEGRGLVAKFADAMKGGNHQ